MADFNFREMTWRYIPAFQNGKSLEVPLAAYHPCTILTEGKWGSENTPVMLASEISREVAEYLVDLHNKAISPPSEETVEAVAIAVLNSAYGKLLRQVEAKEISRAAITAYHAELVKGK